MDTEIDINKLRNEYNFSHTLNESDEDGTLEINYCQVHCDFYDINEFKNITKTLTKNILVSSTSALYMQMVTTCMDYSHNCL